MSGLSRASFGALLAACCLLPGVAAAQSATPAMEPRKVAVVSQIGDQLTFVQYRGQTESRVRPIAETVVPIAQPHFDHVALTAASQALQQRFPSLQVDELAPAKRGHDFDPQRLLEGGRPVAGSPGLAALRAAGYTHLLTISKHRAEARILLAGDAARGSGRLEGLGFYLDSRAVTRIEAEAALVSGFIAPYAYLRLAWLDLQGPSVLAESEVGSARAISAAFDNARNNLWDAMGDEGRVKALSQQIESAVAEALPRLFKPR